MSILLCLNKAEEQQPFFYQRLRAGPSTRSEHPPFDEVAMLQQHDVGCAHVTAATGWYKKGCELSLPAQTGGEEWVSSGCGGEGF